MRRGRAKFASLTAVDASKKHGRYCRYTMMLKLARAFACSCT
jgi:hypothetical protein